MMPLGPLQRTVPLLLIFAAKDAPPALLTFKTPPAPTLNVSFKLPPVQLKAPVPALRSCGGEPAGPVNPPPASSSVPVPAATPAVMLPDRVPPLLRRVVPAPVNALPPFTVAPTLKLRTPVLVST